MMDYYSPNYWLPASTFDFIEFQTKLNTVGP